MNDGLKVLLGVLAGAIIVLLFVSRLGPYPETNILEKMSWAQAR